MSKTARVLVVDDHYAMRESIRLYLEDKYIVETAAAAEEAFKYMADYSVNLVLLDLRMPKMDGITALREIKKRHSDTAVIMMTAYAPARTIQKALRLGAFAFFIKPFDIKKLIVAIDEALHKSAFRGP